MKFKPSKSGLLAIFLWVLSFILACKIQPGTRFIWVPDALLLFGFFPLLISCRARWLWLGFGLGNLFAGFTLVLANVIPDEKFVPYHVLDIKRHLDQYHPFMIWLFIGGLSAAIGIVLLSIKLILWLSKRFKQR
jgi:hypothetical protein